VAEETQQFHLKAQFRDHELYQPLLRSALLVVGTFLFGVVGFVLIGWDNPKHEHLLVDAIYMTTITLTTVGYGETVEIGGNPAGQLFTSLLLLVGVGSFVNFFSNLTAFLVEGDVQQMFWRKRMQKQIERLSNHVIICGAGHTGEFVIQELLDTEREFVVIEREVERIQELVSSFETDFPAVVGDATDDEVLHAAGIREASGLVSCFNNDKDNLIVTVSAHLIKPSLRIISRCTDKRVEKKLRSAGAEKVVSGSRIGGLRMVSEMIRPAAVSFLDEMLRGQQKTIRVESLDVVPGSKLAGTSVGDVRERRIPELLIMAARAKDGAWLYNPADAHRLEVGMSLIFMADAEARQALEHLAKAD
jgi:voltage-gated potassium channel